MRALLIALILLIAPNTALAHLKSDPGVACFKMENHNVVEIENPLSIEPYAHVNHVEAIPNWVSSFHFEQAMHLSIDYQIAHCRPYNIFVAPVYEHQKGVMSYSSPSPTFSPGERQGNHNVFFGFKQRPDSGSINSVHISEIKITITEYGTQQVLAEYTHNIDASWHPHASEIKASEQCINQMVWPSAAAANAPCANATSFELREGFKQIGTLDLNNDGICELVVEVESCRKLNNNICHKIYTERNGHFQEIWQYYNTLYVLQSENNYYQLGSTETGPNQDVHRLGIYDPSKMRYITQRYLSPCR